jgi:hypothetical protein
MFPDCHFHHIREINPPQDYIISCVYEKTSGKMRKYDSQVGGGGSFLMAGAYSQKGDTNILVPCLL